MDTAASRVDDARNAAMQHNSGAPGVTAHAHLRRPPDDAPALDPEYKFGGVPTSSVTGKTADEALIAIQEMAAAQEREAQRRAASLENLGRPTE